MNRKTKSKFNQNKNPFKRDNKNVDKQTKKYEKIGKSLNLKFEIREHVKLLHEYSGDEKSFIKNIPFILLGLTSIILSNRNLISPIIKDYRDLIKEKPDSEVLNRGYVIIGKFLERLKVLYNTNSLEFLATSLTLIKVITSEIPTLFTKAHHFVKINILDLSHALATKANEINKLFFKIPEDQENQNEKTRDLINRLEKLEKSFEKASKNKI